MLTKVIKHFGGGEGMYEKIVYHHRILEAATKNHSVFANSAAQGFVRHFRTRSLRSARQQEEL